VKYALLALMVLAQTASAYLDPGTGSLMFQVLLGSAVGVLYAIKMYWIKIKSFAQAIFTKRKKDESQEK
jgi:hypothetical protein